MWKQKLLYSTGWRDAWTNWILLPITPSCSQAPFKAPDFLSALWKGGVSLLAGSFYFHFCTSHQSDHAGPSAASPIFQCSRWCGSAITDQLTGLIRICPWYSQQHTGEIVFMRGGLLLPAHMQHYSWLGHCGLSPGRTSVCSGWQSECDRTRTVHRDTDYNNNNIKQV